MKRGKPDFWLILLAFLLLGFGLVMVFSASYFNGYTDPDINDSYYYFKKQLLFALIGLFLFFLCFKHPLLQISQVGCPHLADLSDPADSRANDRPGPKWRPTLARVWSFIFSTLGTREDWNDHIHSLHHGEETTPAGSIPARTAASPDCPGSRFHSPDASASF